VTRAHSHACMRRATGATGDRRAGRASALREYERRHAKREEHAHETLGGFAAFLAHVIDEPQSTKAWQQEAKPRSRPLTASRST